MDLHRNRTTLLTTAALIGLAALTTACSGDVESVSSTGTAGGRAGVEQSAPSTLPGTLAPRPDATTTDPATDPPPPAPNQTVAVGPTFATTIPDPNPSLPAPEPTAAPTIPASGPDPALLDCGVVYRASGWPTTFAPNPTTFTCLADAFAAGTPARLVDREQTDGEGGAILVTTYDVLGPGDLRMTVDATSAADRPQVVTVSRCTGVVAEMMELVVSGCTVVG